MLIHRSRQGVLVLVAGVALGAMAPAATAQDRIEPAATIRVVEVLDPQTGRMAREVIGSLSPAEVLRLQVELAGAGFDPGVRTGALDRATRDALATLQAARGLEICGCPTYETVIALGVLPQVVEASADPSTHAADGRYGRAASQLIYVAYPVNVYTIGHSATGSFRRSRSEAGVGVIVGHQPARGAGALDRRSPPPRPQGSGSYRIAPRRPGGQITSGQRPAPPAPRPAPSQRAARPNRF
ncbi:MAG: peptidoglycan-binding domain-containing protein [Gemmatimonadota bacterium]